MRREANVQKPHFCLRLRTSFPLLRNGNKHVQVCAMIVVGKVYVQTDYIQEFDLLVPLPYSLWIKFGDKKVCIEINSIVWAWTGMFGKIEQPIFVYAFCKI